MQTKKKIVLAIIIYAAILHHLECQNSVAMDALVFTCYSFFWWVGWGFFPTNPHDKRMTSSFLCPCCLVLSSQYVLRVCLCSIPSCRDLFIFAFHIFTLLLLYTGEGWGRCCRFSLDQPCFLSDLSSLLGN